MKKSWKKFVALILAAGIGFGSIPMTGISALADEEAGAQQEQTGEADVSEGQNEATEARSEETESTPDSLPDESEILPEGAAESEENLVSEANTDLSSFLGKSYDEVKSSLKNVNNEIEGDLYNKKTKEIDSQEGVVTLYGNPEHQFVYKVYVSSNYTGKIFGFGGGDSLSGLQTYLVNNGYEKSIEDAGEVNKYYRYTKKDDPNTFVTIRGVRDEILQIILEGRFSKRGTVLAKWWPLCINGETVTDWNNYIFENFVNTDSTQFQPKLAYLLALMAEEAYDNQDGINTVLEQLGFSENDIALYNYEKEGRKLKETSEIAFVLATKTLEDGTQIVLIDARGTSDWDDRVADISVAINDEGIHSGFANAASRVMLTLDEFKRNKSINNSKVRYFVTGHSYGAATANLVGRTLVNRLGDPQKVYDYTFASPNVVFMDDLKQSGLPSVDGFDNIFNIVNANDRIGFIPGYGLPNRTIDKNLRKAWGKYGRILFFSENWRSVGSLLPVIRFDFHHHSMATIYLTYMKKMLPLSAYKTWSNIKEIVEGKIKVDETNNRNIDNKMTNTPESESSYPSVVGFTDIPSNAYYKNAVIWAYNKKIVTGTSKTTFSPNAPCTRAQMATFLYRMNGSPKVSGTMPFTDVKNDYSYNAILWASQKGITSGKTKTTFDPKAPCTRGQMAMFLYRMKGSPKVSGNSGFSDVKGTESTAVTWAKQNGVTKGTSASKYEPGKACTRGQMVEFLYRSNNIKPAANSASKSSTSTKAAETSTKSTSSTNSSLSSGSNWEFGTTVVDLQTAKTLQNENPNIIITPLS